MEGNSEMNGGQVRFVTTMITGGEEATWSLEVRKPQGWSRTWGEG